MKLCFCILIFLDLCYCVGLFSINVYNRHWIVRDSFYKSLFVLKLFVGIKKGGTNFSVLREIKLRSKKKQEDFKLYPQTSFIWTVSASKGETVFDNTKHENKPYVTTPHVDQS